MKSYSPLPVTSRHYGPSPVIPIRGPRRPRRSDCKWFAHNWPRAKELTPLKTRYRQYPQLWAHQRGNPLARTVVGGAGTTFGLMMNGVIDGPDMPTAFANSFVLHAAWPILGVLLIGGGTLTAGSSLINHFIPQKWRLVQRNVTWGHLLNRAAIRAVERTTAPASTGTDTATAAGVRQALTDLFAEWADYRLDIEAWYLTKPLLHDVTGTVETTIAYETALQDLVAAVDNLHTTTAPVDLAAASAIADRAWAAWHEANDYAAQVGLGDRTPTERAALQRLTKLVTRLTRSTANDPELPKLKRDIQSCLDKVTTVAVTWNDIAALPAAERAGLLPQLAPAPAPEA